MIAPPGGEDYNRPAPQDSLLEIAPYRLSEVQSYTYNQHKETHRATP
jgi:hypothetical protein